MSALNLSRDFKAARFQTFANFLRLAHEGIEREPNFHKLRKLGVLKAYYEGKIVLAVSFDIPLPPHKFCLVFARVPSGGKHREAFDVLRSDIGELGRCNMRLDGESDRVLIVCDGSERSDQVVSAGVSIRSSVWLMQPD